MSVSPPGPDRRRRPPRRDRRGRGLRGIGLPPGVPVSRSRSERFDDLALDAWEHVARRWESELARVDLAVEDVPPELPESDTDVLEDGRVPLARLTRAGADGRTVLVLFRRPLEARSTDDEDLADLVHDVVVEEVAAILGRDPDEVDPPQD